MINYQNAPNNFGDAWKIYVECGVRMGSFAEALLTNNLPEAMARADSININLIPAHIRWMMDNLPEECWGSRESYEAWRKKGGLRGRVSPQRIHIEAITVRKPSSNR